MGVQPSELLSVMAEEQKMGRLFVQELLP